MAFNAELTSMLTGASLGQLSGWRRTGLLAPEVTTRPRALYSFRDLIALRTFVRLRRDLPLQRIRIALGTLRDYDLTDHPSSYTLVAHAGSIALYGTAEAMDLVQRPGQQILVSLDDVFSPFTNMQGREVVDFRRPRPSIEVRERRLGGWPTIAGTRVGYDAVANLLSDESMTAEEVEYFYPSVSAHAARQALEFDRSVRALRTEYSA